MTTRKKRIRAELKRAYEDETPFGGQDIIGEEVYLIRRADVPALIEQMGQDCVERWIKTADRDFETSIAHAFKQAGITAKPRGKK